MWFAFILVSLKYRKHRYIFQRMLYVVVICFHFSIFEVSETSIIPYQWSIKTLWFAFILVSLKYRKHLEAKTSFNCFVVICFHFSIFEVSETSIRIQTCSFQALWFAFILVSLKYRKHLIPKITYKILGCDLLSF